MKYAHVIGAGLSGLAAALSLTGRGWRVVLHEAGPAAGGRCRSYFDKELGIRIDNGNHLILSGNRAARAFIEEIGAPDRFHPLDVAAFHFIDIRTRERWVVRPNAGRLPWWIFDPARRVPGTRLTDYWQMLRLALIQDDRPVAESMRRGRLYWRLVEPLAVAALNTPTHDGLARLLGAVMRETLMRGGKACIPLLPKEGLSEGLTDPAIATLETRGADIRFNSRIAELILRDGRVVALRAPEGEVALAERDAVVLAVPPWVAADLLPGLEAPDAFQAIVNIHFKHPADPAGPLGTAGFIGLVGGFAEWVFIKPGHVSVTISAANALVDESARSLAQRAWLDVADALGLGADAQDDIPPFRVVKEKRATFAATASQEGRRPLPQTAFATNLALAGDWTDTGLPATIEGAIRSGRAAADVIQSL